MAKLTLWCCAFVLLSAALLGAESRAVVDNSPKQLQLLGLLGTGKETSTPDFVRLVVMRLIYGLASTMGVEDRLEGILNGVFVPPNADEGLFGGFGGGDDDDDGGLGLLFDDI